MVTKNINYVNIKLNNSLIYLLFKISTHCANTTIIMFMIQNLN